MKRDGIYWLPYHELDSRLLCERPTMKAADRDQHFQDLYLSGCLRRRGDGADAIALAGYRAANSGADRDFNALLVSLQRLAPERSGYLVRVSFEEICRDGRHFYPEDLDCKPQWVHSLLMLLGVAPENMPSEGPWDLLASEVRVAVECQTVEEFLDASAASKRREKRFAATRQVRDYAGSTVVGALHDDIAEGALERWQLGQFADAVQACLHVVHKAVEARAGVRCVEDVPNLLLTVFSTRTDDTRAESKGFKACGSVRLRLPGSDGKGEVTQKNRQDALRHLAVGFQKGIRNPRSHEPRDLSEVEALEILCLASLVLRLIDECEVVDLTMDPVGEA